MSEPELAGQQTGRDADKCSGNNVTDEVPVTGDQQRCGKEQERGKRQNTRSVKPNEYTCERSRDDHVAGRETAAGRAAQEVEGMMGTVQNGGGIRYPKKELQRAVIDCISTYGGEAGEHGGLTEWRQMPTRNADDHQPEGNRSLNAEENGTPKTCCETFS